MKYMTILGIIAGILVALAVILNGFPGFLWAILFGAIGAVVGAHFDGRIDLRSIFDNVSSGRGGRG